jgi:hypothetical protein
MHGIERFDHEIDSFSFHSGMAPMLFATLDIRRNDYNFALGVKMIEIWRKASDLILYGDYYPLTPFHRSQEKWVVRQFDQPENGKGLIQGFRLPACSQDEFLIFPQGLEPEAAYILENPESGEMVEMANQI